MRCASEWPARPGQRRAGRLRAAAGAGRRGRARAAGGGPRPRRGRAVGRPGVSTGRGGDTLAGRAAEPGTLPARRPPAARVGGVAGAAAGAAGGGDRHHRAAAVSERGQISVAACGLLVLLVLAGYLLGTLATVDQRGGTAQRA